MKVVEFEKYAKDELREMQKEARIELDNFVKNSQWGFTVGEYQSYYRVPTDESYKEWRKSYNEKDEYLTALTYAYINA